jgi:fibronectin-binding autotransporter adhesin
MFVLCPYSFVDLPSYSSLTPQLHPMKPTFALRRFFAIAGSTVLAISYAHAQSNSWLGDSAGNWNDAARWTGGVTIADGADNTATFGNVITADRIVTLGADRTIGNITASDTSHNYTISGANILTLDRTDATAPTINVTQSGRTLTISSQIAGNDGLRKSGAGTLLLSGANSYSGGTVVNAGVITVGNNSAFGTGTITVTGNSTINSVYGSFPLMANALHVNSGVTLTTDGSTQYFGMTFTGPVTGSGTIKTGSSGNDANDREKLGLTSASNTFTGTLVNEGGSAIINVNSLGDGGKIELKTGTGGLQLGAGTASSLLFNTRQVELFGSSVLRNNNASAEITFTVNTALTYNGAGVRTLTLEGSNTGANAFNGSIGNNGADAVTITKAGGGRWTLSNASNSYTGGTNISGGTLGFASGALGSSGAINASGGTLLWLPGNTQDISSRLAFTAATTSTFNTNGNDVTFASAIGSSTTGNFVKTGLGTLTLQGANTFTSGTKQLNGGGTLVLDYSSGNDNRKLSTGALTLAGGTIVLKGGTTTAETASSTIFNTTNAGTFFVRDGGTAKINLNAFSVGTQSVVSFSHGSMATTDRLNVAGILGAWFTVGNRWATNAGVGGAGGSAGAGAAADGDIVGYTGGTTFTPGSATSQDVNYDLAGGATLTGSRLTNTLRIESTANDQILNLGGNTLTVHNLTGTNALSGTSGGLLYAGGANGNYTITGTSGARLTPFNGNGQALLINVSTGGTLNLDVALSNSGSTLNKAGEGTLVMQKDSAGFTAETRVYQGALRLASANATGTIAGGITVQNGAALELTGGISFVADALNITGEGVSSGGALKNFSGANTYQGAITIGTGGARINSAASTLTLTGGVVTAGNNVTFGGAGNTTVSTAAISGAGGLAKDGAGRLNLSFANTYTGATNVNEGTLEVSGAGSINTSSGITVAAGASLVYNSSTALTKAPTLNGTPGNPAIFSGSGNLGSIAMSLNSLDDVISPGNSPGIQAYGASQTWSSFTYEWELNDWDDKVAGIGGNIDQIQVTGTLDLSGTEYALDILSLTTGDVSGDVHNFAETDNVWTILTTTGGITNFDALEWDINALGFTNSEIGTWSLGLGNSNQDLILTYTAVPEPGAALLGSLGFLLILRRRR